MTETNTTTMEPTTTTRKTRVRKPYLLRIAAFKAAVTKALKNEWLLQNAIAKQAKIAELARARVAKLTEESRDAWNLVQARCVDCVNAHASQAE
jgi:hypothetical protein